MFELRFFLIPLTVARTKFRVTSSSYIGYMEIYIFGIRIAKIQMTNPW